MNYCIGRLWTFDRRQAASAWADRRETELQEPGAIDRIKVDDPTLAQVIDRYIDESKKAIGRTKTQVLRTIKSHDIADMKCSKIASADLIAFAQALPVSPQTVQNYLSHLGAIFAIARPAWGYPLDQQAIKDAFAVAKRLGVTAKGRQRDRRPTIAELDRLLNHFATVQVEAAVIDTNDEDHSVRDLLDAPSRGNRHDQMGGL